MVSGFSGQKFDALKFVMAENLPQDLWNRSEKKTGLVIVATKINSVPKDVVFPVNTSPVRFIKELCKEEDIDQNQLAILIKTLKETKEVI